MVFRLGAASLVALTLVSATARADDPPPAGGQQQAQAEGGSALDAALLLPQEIQDILNDQRPLAEMTEDELRQRMRSARQFAKQQGLPDEVRQSLQEIAKAARAELDARGEQPAKKVEEQMPAPAEQPVEQTAPQPEQQPVEEVAPQPAPKPVQEATPEPTVEPAPIVEEAPVVKAAEPVVQQPAPAVDKVEVQELDGNKASPEAEAKAKAFLAGDVAIDTLSDDELRARLDAMRDLMAGNELSQMTERALRKKLQAERRVLRGRMAAAQAAEDALAAKKAAEAEAKKAQEPQADGEPVAKPGKANKPKIIFAPQITITTPRPRILADRRRSEDLSDDELRRRVETYRDVESDEAYLDFDPGMRDYWRETMRRDRELLRRRLLEERQLREEELAASAGEDDFDIEDEFQPGRKVPRDVFEAEADESELEDILVAPPRRRVSERYTVEDIADSEQLRNAMPRIEIDTIRFGFNEAFVREEEVESLDRIASIIERVLKKRPREIFLIEGHTDAVGSDAYNLKLSRARAEAIKRALTSYYIIPARNLKTVGLGERYLKIPTSEAEAENRRASLSRATPLIGELEE